MQLFSLFKRLVGKERSYVPEQWTTLSGGSESDSRNPLVANKEWVFVAVDRLGTAMTGIRFKAMRYQANGDDQEVFTGPLVNFLERPGKGYTGKDFIYLNTVYKELTGNAFWERVGNELKPLIPTQMSPVVVNGAITAFKYATGDGSTRTISIDDVLHDRYVDPAKPYWGMSKLSKISRWVDTSAFSSEFLRRFFLNGATFGGFIETEEESEERIKLIKLGIANDHVGVENAHKTGVLPKGAKYQKVTGNMAEIEMGATDDRYRDKILGAFGVPKTLIGLTTEVNRASAEAAEYVFSRYTVKPIADDFISFLNTSVAPLFDRTGKYYFAYDDFVPVNQEIVLKEREIALGRQAYKTVNEVRAECGLPPIKGGDTVYGDPFKAPLGDPAPMDPVPDNTDNSDNEPKKAIPPRLRQTEERERSIEAVVKDAFSVVKDVVREEAPIASPDRMADEVVHKKFVARVDAHEKLLAQKVRDFNNRQQRDVTIKLNQMVKAVNKSDLFDLNEEMEILIDAVSPMLRGLMLEQAIEEYKAEGFEGTFDSEKSTITRAIELAAKRLARSYNKTTAGHLKKVLNDGISAGDSVSQLAERVKSVYEYANEVRALAVARTESVYIANEGSREAYRQSGIVKTIRWYTAEDEKVCEYCGPMDGKVIGITEVFFNKGTEVQGRDGGTLKTTYRAIDVPPLHTNCRCLIRPEESDIS